MMRWWWIMLKRGNILTFAKDFIKRRGKNVKHFRRTVSSRDFGDSTFIITEEFRYISYIARARLNTVRDSWVWWVADFRVAERYICFLLCCHVISSQWMKGVSAFLKWRAAAALPVVFFSWIPYLLHCVSFTLSLVVRLVPDIFSFFITLMLCWLSLPVQLRSTLFRLSCHLDFLSYLLQI